MPHSPNQPGVYSEAKACRPRHFPAGPHRLPNRAKGPASCAAISRPSACAGNPSLLGHVTRRRGGYGRLKDFTAIPPATGVAGFLARSP